MAFNVQNIRVGDYIELENHPSFYHGNNAEIDKNLPVVVKDRNVTGKMVRVEFNKPLPDRKLRSDGDFWINEVDIKGKCVMDRAVEYEKIRQARKNKVTVKNLHPHTNSTVKITLSPPTPDSTLWYKSSKLDEEPKPRNKQNDRNINTNNVKFQPGQKVMIKLGVRPNFHYETSGYTFCDANKPFVVAGINPSDPNCISVRYNRLVDGAQSSVSGDFWLFGNQVDLIKCGTIPSHCLTSIFMPDKVGKDKND